MLKASNEPQSKRKVKLINYAWEELILRMRDLVRNGPETCHMTLKLPWKWQ